MLRTFILRGKDNGVSGYECSAAWMEFAAALNKTKSLRALSLGMCPLLTGVGLEKFFAGVRSLRAFDMPLKVKG